MGSEFAAGAEVSRRVSPLGTVGRRWIGRRPPSVPRGLPANPADRWHSFVTDGDDAVSGIDLGVLLSEWGGPGEADLDGDGVVSGIDLGIVLAGWGPCP